MKDIKELRITDFNNVFVINDNHAKDSNLTEDLLKNATVVYVREGFESIKRRVQWFDDEKYINNLYFIGKTNTVLERYDFMEYLTKHQDKTFVLINDSDYGWGHKPLVYMTSEPNKLVLRAYDIGDDYRFKPIFTLENINGKTIWKPAKINDKNLIQAVDPIAPAYYDRGIKYLGMYGNRRNDGSIEYRSVEQVFLYNPEQKGFITIDLGKIMNTYINIVGENRITAKYHGDGVEFNITADEFSVGDINCKYGVQANKIDDYYDYSTPSYDVSDVYPKSDLDEETYKRVTEYIETCIKTDVKTKRAPGVSHYYSDDRIDKAAIICKDLVVISAPAPKHQCPTFHYFIGVKSNVCEKIDIIELVRGELYMKTMIPKTCYVLDKSGVYCRVKNKMFSGMKNLVGEGEIDSVTLQEWSEDKALHPELIDAVIKSGKIDVIGLPTLKIFNNLPFGALFIEQLVKDDKLILAKQLGEYIYYRADRMEFTCNSLSDVFPDANPEGGSLLKAFNLTKPCYDLLFELVGPMVDNYESDYCEGRWFKAGSAVKRCIEMYKLIKAYIPTGVVTSENRKLLSQYIYLKDNNSVHFRDYRNHSEFDLLDHPKLIKPIYKMINKITTSFHGSGNEWEARRHYDEILTAYIKFLMLGWNPEDYKIFIEFGLSGSWSEMIKELTEREAAANKALKIYEDKINEAAHKKNEDQYKIRKENIEKLAAKQIIVKDSAGQNHLYSIIVPSQIYGEDTVGSIEKEGKDMHHCLFRQYADQISNGTYTVVYLRDKHDPDTSLVTIGINREGRINQTYGVNDSWITEQQAQAIAQWAKSKEGLVTFKAERSIVSPGGWNNCVNLPVLKIVDQNWLRKLAQIA